MKIELVNPNLLKPYDSNPRKNKDAVSLIKKSINEFGFRQPIVVDEDNIILVGHTRLLAAKELELKKVPVHKVTHLSDAQKRAYRIMDNKSAEQSEWDMDLLKQEINLLPLDKIEFSGFDLTEVDILNNGWNADFESIDNLETVDTPNMEKIIIECNSITQKKEIAVKIIDLLKQLKINDVTVS
jgi:hypothetical protein